MSRIYFARFLPALFVIVLASATFAAASADTRPARDSRISGQYIVVFQDSVTDADSTEQDLLARGGERLNSYRTAIRGFSARLSDEEVTTIRNDPRVAFVSEDHVISIADRTADRTDAFTSAHESRRRPSWPPPTPAPPAPTPSPTPPPPPASTQTLPTGVARINAEGKSNTGSGVQVAVIDTGIDLTHPDLQANILGGRNCTSNNASDFGDQNGHGTHVAGTIAALNNGYGVVGVAPDAKLWSIRVLDANGSGTWSSVICGLDVVAANGPANGGSIKVANMSLGGGGISDNNCGNTNNDALHKAVCRVRDAGVTLVVAAGNDGSNAAGFVPAAYDDAVITVSALDDTDGKAAGLGGGNAYGADDTFASFSNWGPVVDLGAPGVNIYSTWLNQGYATLSGTSMATPHVTGAATLYIASHPGLSWSTVRDALISSAESAGAGHSDPSQRHPEPVLRAETL